ncbi:MAG: hypothetical protein K0U52_14260 [Gammaproteobacteria bacterium]|nr:hypothetical protein [Gammaproteobacteria bacterium]
MSGHTNLSNKHAAIIFKHGSKELMEQLYQYGEKEPIRDGWFYWFIYDCESLLDLAIEVDSLEACQWAVKKFGCRFTYSLARKALQYPRVSILTWVNELGVRICQRRLLMEAGRRGFLAVVKLFCEHGSWYSQSSSNTMYDFVSIVSSQRHWHVLQWCFGENKIQWDDIIEVTILRLGGQDVLSSHFGEYYIESN